MSYNEKWNLIVTEYNNNLSCKEEIVQKTWELLFKMLFGYSDFEIEPQRPIDMGSTKFADIVIKNEHNEDLFVVELKRHNTTDKKGEGQLFSYLKMEEINLGILIGNKIVIYDFTSKKEYEFVEIPFEPDNQNGVKFVELFSKENFDKQKIKDFIKEVNDSKNAISKISEDLTEKLVIELLRKHFTEKYPLNVVDDVLKDYDVAILKKMPVSFPIEHGLKCKSQQTKSNDVESEIIKVRRKVPGWFRNPSHINSMILLCFLILEEKYQSVTYQQLENNCKKLGIEKFKGNFDQMVKISEKNHAKVFDVKFDNVYLWSEVKDFIYALFNDFKQQESMQSYISEMKKIIF